MRSRTGCNGVVKWPCWAILNCMNRVSSGTRLIRFPLLRSVFMSILLACFVAHASAVTVTIENRGEQDRQGVVVEVPVSLLAESGWAFPALSVGPIEATSDGNAVPTQIAQSLLGTERVLLLWVDVPAGSSIEVVLGQGAADLEAVAEALGGRAAGGRLVPERSNDFAWENDRVAFRLYGTSSALGQEGSGVDCWLKRVPHPIIDTWYRQNAEGMSYHRDHGEGLDNYSVGPTRGCGGVRIWLDGVSVTSSVFDAWRIIDDGPLRFTFELTYDEAWSARGASVVETKRVLIDLGEDVWHCLSRFTDADGAPLVDLNVAVGLMDHTQGEGEQQDVGAVWRASREVPGVLIDPESRTDGTQNASPTDERDRSETTNAAARPQRNSTVGHLRRGDPGLCLWGPHDGAMLGTAIRLKGHRYGTASWSHEGHERTLYLGTRTDDEGRLAFLAGFAWSRAGHYESAEAWHSAIAALADDTVQLSVAVEP